MMDAGVSLRDYQVADLSFYMQNPKCLNLSDPGTGKTPSVCVMQWFLWSVHKVGTVWPQPKRLMAKNRDEILRFTEFEPDDVVIVDGTKDQIEKQLSSGAKVFLMGFDRYALSWKDLPPYVRAVHVDEFHMGFKNADSRRTQQLFQSMHRMDWFLAMTGTIIDGKLTSAYPAIRIIDSRYYVSQTAFENFHSVKDFDGNIIGWQNHWKLTAIFGKHAIRRTFSSVHGAQDPILIPRVVPMSVKQRSMYDKFHKEAVLDLDKFFLDGTQPGVAFIRARQLMEHPNEFPDLTTPGQFIDVTPGELSGKEEQLLIDLADHEQGETPFIIFSALVPQQRRIAELMTKMGFRFGLINGQTSAKESAQIDEAFRRGDLQGVICSPECAAVGYNWQFSGSKEVPHVIMMSMSYRDTIFIQAVQRAIRGPRKTGLRVSIYEYQNSLDQHIMKIIHKKSVDANKVDPTRPVLQLSGFQKDYSIV